MTAAVTEGENMGVEPVKLAGDRAIEPVMLEGVPEERVELPAPNGFDGGGGICRCMSGGLLFGEVGAAVSGAECEACDGHGGTDGSIAGLAGSSGFIGVVLSSSCTAVSSAGLARTGIASVIKGTSAIFTSFPGLGCFAGTSV